MRTLGLAVFAAMLVGLAVAQDVEFVDTVDEVAQAPPVSVPEAASAEVLDAQTAPEMPDVVGMTVTEAVLAIRDVAADLEVLLFAEEFHAFAPSRLDSELAEETISATHPPAEEPLVDGFAGLLVGQTRFEFPDGQLATPWWWPAHAIQAADGADGPCLQCHTEGSCVQCHVEMASRYALRPDGTYVLEGERDTTATLQDLKALDKALRSALSGMPAPVEVLGMSGSMSGDVFVEIVTSDEPLAVTRAVTVCVPAAFETAPTMTRLVVRCLAPGERLPFVAITVEQDTARVVDWSSVGPETLPDVVDGYADLN